MKSGSFARIWWSMVIGLCVLAPDRSPGQQQPDQPEKPAQEEVTEALIEGRIKQLEESKDLDDETKQRLITIYKQATEQLTLAKDRRNALGGFQKEMDGVTDEQSKLQKLLDQPTSSDPVDESLKVVELEQLLGSTKEQLAAAQEQLQGTKAVPAVRAARRKLIPNLINEAKQRVESIEKDLAVPPRGDVKLEQVQANRALLLARLQAAQQDLLALQKETANYDTTNPLIAMRHDVQERQVGKLQKQIELLTSWIEKKRKDEAAAQARDARLALINAHPAVKDLAADNAELAALRDGPEGLANKIKKVSAYSLSISEVLTKLSAARTDIEEKLKIPGIDSSVIAPALLKQRDDLPKTRQHEANIRGRKSEIANAQFQLLDLEKKRVHSSQIEEGSTQTNSPPLERPKDVGDAEVKKRLEELLTARAEILSALKNDYTRYFNELVNLTAQEQILVAETESFRNLLHEHIFWIPSTQPFGPSQIQPVIGSITWVCDSANWIELGDCIMAAFGSNPSVTGFLLVCFLTLAGLQGRVRRRIRSIGLLTSQSYTEPIKSTLIVVFLSFTLALLGPLVMTLIAWRVLQTTSITPFARSAMFALLTTAGVFGTLELFRQVCRPMGLAEAHFRWRPQNLATVRRNLRWFLVVGLPLVFVLALMQAQEEQQRKDSLGRLSLVIGLTLLALFQYRVLKDFRGTEGGILRRTKKVWLPLAIAAPLALAAISLIGYHFTAVQLTWSLQVTVWLVIGMVGVYETLLRWLYSVRGRLALEQAKQKMAQRQEGEGGESQPAGPAEEKPSSDPDEENCAETALSIDLKTVNVQTRRLLKSFIAIVAIAGVWLIWSDFLPALGVLNFGVWETTRQVTEVVGGISQSVPKPFEITLGHLVFAGFIMWVSIAAARDIPGLLEVVLLDRMGLDSGLRYAVITLCRYMITIIGVVVSCSIVGLGWSKLQWLAAAMTVGLGFGLQEIFANFVSGIIILFERPIRLGDIVTVGDTSGTVSEIKMRATTVTDWDKKNLVIPNKEFITGRVMNWTLLDHTNRIVVHVGVSYSTDPGRARDLLLQVATQHPSITDDPAPFATFEGFGDSTLNLVLRAYLLNFENRIEIIHQLHVGVKKAFDEAGIEIAFPQMDLHVRTIDGTLNVDERSTAAKPYQLDAFDSGGS